MKTKQRWRLKKFQRCHSGLDPESLYCCNYKIPDQVRNDGLSIFSFFILIFLLFCASTSQAIGLPTISFGTTDANTPEQVSTGLQVLFLLTILSIAPSILLMTTCFTRIVIVLGFVRQAMGTQNMPPTQVVIGLSLFLTFFIMSPTLVKINNDALQPYLAEEITQEVALNSALAPCAILCFRK